MSRRRLITPLLAATASLLLGYFVLTKISFGDVAAVWPRLDPLALGAGLVTYFMANVVRARRFRALTRESIDTGPMLRAVIIQNILNTFLPFKAGEVSYLYMIHRTGTVKPGDNVGSLLGARVLDLVAALTLPLVAVPFSQAWAAPGHPFLWFVAAAVLAAGGFGLGVWRAEPLAAFFARRATTKRAWLNRGLLIVGDTLNALAQLRNAALLGRVVRLTLTAWFLVYLSGYFNLMGVGLPVPLADAVFAYSFPNIASMMPFYMLGGFGVFESAFGVGLHLIGIPIAAAIAASVALHVIDLLFVLALAPVTLLLRSAPKAT